VKTTTAKRKSKIPPQQQKVQPGREHEMEPRPASQAREYQAAGKLRDRVALITGGDSGIGRAVAVMFAKEGADVAVVYLEEHRDAEETKHLVETEKRRCLLLPGDISEESFCRQAVTKTIEHFGHLEILVNNAAVQFPQESVEKITADQLDRTFRTNLFAHFHLITAALPHLREGAAVIGTTSITAYEGSPHLLDYACTKPAS